MVKTKHIFIITVGPDNKVLNCIEGTDCYYETWENIAEYLQEQFPDKSLDELEDYFNEFNLQTKELK